MKYFSRKMPVVALAAASLALSWGCAATETRPNEASPAASSELAANGLTAASVNPALETLWNARRNDSKDFAVGPGDVLEIQVPGVKELSDETVRVDGKGDIDLPLLGSLHVVGLSERELDAVLVNKLGDYLYHPQAEIFVKNYNNRQVSVSGAVRNPLDYTLNGPEDTVRALIQRAGGMTQDASPEIVLTPAGSDPGAPTSANAKGTYTATAYDATSVGSGTDSADLDEASSNFGHPLIIDLSRDSQQGRYLDLPVRPGDTIFVPAAGTVSTIGWINRSQTLPITHNLSVMGAIAASGGTLFAADEHDVRIVRRESEGKRAVMRVDIAGIQAGKSPDVPLRDGDIVDVPYSALKIPGYAFYYAAQGVLSYAPAALLVTGVP